jgi:hypothetical protein
MSRWYSKAFAARYVPQYASALPGGFYMAADNACTLPDRILIAYCGVDKLDPSKGVINCYLS